MIYGCAKATLQASRARWALPVLLLAVAACADPSGEPGHETGAPAVADQAPAAETAETSRTQAAYVVVGTFEAQFSAATGTMTIRMVEALDDARKSAATPGMDDSYAQNRDPGDFSASRTNTFRFEQDSSGNGQSVTACEQFWIDGWNDFDASWPFWVPVAARPDWLTSLEGAPGENRFCTNFRLRNDYTTPVQDLWIIVDGFTNPSVRAFADAAPRTVPSPEVGEPDIILEPFSSQGMFRYGSFAPGETINGQWYFYFGGSPVADFTVRGRLVDILHEVCGNDQDNNGDGLVDNGCGTFQAGADCILDADCLSDACVGGVPGEFGSFTLGECAASDIGGSCFDSSDCVGASGCVGGDVDSLTIGTCVDAVPVEITFDMEATGVSFGGTFDPMENQTWLEASVPCTLAGPVTVVRDDHDEVLIRWLFTDDDEVRIAEHAQWYLDAYLTSNGDCGTFGGDGTSENFDDEIWDFIPAQSRSVDQRLFNLLGSPYDAIRALVEMNIDTAGPQQFSGVTAFRDLRGGGEITWEYCFCEAMARIIVPGDRSGDPEVAAEEVGLFSLVSSEFGGACSSNGDCDSDVCDPGPGVCTHPSGLPAGCYDAAFGACNTTFASPVGVDSGSCGDLATNPCRNPSTAMASQPGRAAVALAAGTYVDDIVLEGSQAPSLIGGFSSDFTTRSTTPTDRAEILATEATGLLVRDLASPVMISMVSIAGADATTGEPAIGLEVRNSGSFLWVENALITAGNGSDGQAGSQGAPGTQGMNGLPSGSQSGAAGGGGGCGSGGAGGNGANSVHLQNGLPGGNGAGAPFPGGTGGSGGEGATFAGATHGSDGNNGSTPATVLAQADPAAKGFFSNPDWEWVNPTAFSGGAGACGGGGGGGGGAGAFTSAGPIFPGGGGGGGGAGGFGGGGGTGATSGTPSIGMVVVNSTVGVENTDILTGSGGAGGTGGAGGLGGTGGTGGLGYEPGTGGSGGRGGNGGTGSNGHCGGSGAGGNTVGIWTLGTGVVNESGTTITHGLPGAEGGPVAGCALNVPNPGVSIDRM